MSVDLNDEIVQDFLVEAGEILDSLGEQLVDLEMSPEDRDLLNAVFRGFHTIKGGAGFLALDNLVEISHKAEDVFDLLRQGERVADAALMDKILTVVDILNEMFDEIRSGQEPGPADPALIADLKILAEGGHLGGGPAAAAGSEPEVTESEEPVADTAPEVEVEASAADTGGVSDEAPAEAQDMPEMTDAEYEEILDAITSPEPDGDDDDSPEKPAADSDLITEDEFEDLLDELHGKGKMSVGGNSEKNAADDAAGGSDLITEDEFENLLDELHGKGKMSVIKAEGDAGDGSADQTKDKAAAADPDLITEDEFENLLDDLHGKGKMSVIKKPADAENQPAQAAKPAPPPAPPAAEKTPPPAKAEAAAAKKPAAAQPQAESTVRVETSILDKIMNMVGEMVLVRNRLKTLETEIENENLSKTIGNLDLVTSDLQAAAMKTRMQPVKKVFGRFPRVVRDLARSMNKEINLEMFGEDTDLDKNLVEALADPMVHLVRNSVDHGIEMPDVREANGKPRKGTVKLSAQTEGDHILLMITDDGGGMDADKLRSKAVEKGLMDDDAAARLSDKECFELIFAAGFSTKEQISDVSGRGVGMDVVKTKINQLNGTVEIDSRLGEGTVISIKLPLTLAIMPTLMVFLGEQIFALPLVNVNEIIDFDMKQLNIIDGQQVMLVRGKPLPLFYLSRWLVKGVYDQFNEQGHVVVVDIGTQRIGLLVDRLIGQEEVVIKPLGAMLQGLQGLSGATITGDGRIALILDLPSLIQVYAGHG